MGGLENENDHRFKPRRRKSRQDQKIDKNKIKLIIFLFFISFFPFSLFNFSNSIQIHHFTLFFHFYIFHLADFWQNNYCPLPLLFALRFADQRWWWRGTTANKLPLGGRGERRGEIIFLRLAVNGNCFIQGKGGDENERNGKAKKWILAIYWGRGIWAILCIGILIKIIKSKLNKSQTKNDHRKQSKIRFWPLQHSHGSRTFCFMQKLPRQIWGRRPGRKRLQAFDRILWQMPIQQ